MMCSVSLKRTDILSLVRETRSGRNYRVASLAKDRGRSLDPGDIWPVTPLYQWASQKGLHTPTPSCSQYQRKSRL